MSTFADLSSYRGWDALVPKGDSYALGMILVVDILEEVSPEDSPQSTDLINIEEEPSTPSAEEV